MILKQPFPSYTPSLNALRFPFIAGFVVFVIILFFKPFSFWQVKSPYFPLHAGIYGLGTFIMSALNSFFIPRLFPSWFQEKVWTVGRELIMMLWQIVTISFINMLLTQLLYNTPLSYISIVHFIAYTAAVGIFPVTILVLVKFIILLKRNQNEATKIEEHIIKEQAETVPSPDYITLTGDYQNEVLALPADNICFISSADNYIKVFYMDNGKLVSKVLRSTLKKIAETLQNYPQFFRCHRTYIVNLNQVNKVSGNAQGLKLHLDNAEEIIPVSRNLNQQLTHHMQQQKST